MGRGYFVSGISEGISRYLRNNHLPIIQALAEQPQSVSGVCVSERTEYVLDCPEGSEQVCIDGSCGVDFCHPTQFSLTCSEQEREAVNEQLLLLDELFLGAAAGAMDSPMEVHAVVFCTGDVRYLLPQELARLTVAYRNLRTIGIESATTALRIRNSVDGQSVGALSDFLSARASDASTGVSLSPVYENRFPTTDPVTGKPLDGGAEAVRSELAFYLHDHLGNTRVTFRSDGPDQIAINYTADYYPYGKILREYRACKTPRYLSTHHERDQATGYDNRGARLYDSEIGRFLGVDPMAGKFPGYSPYNYVLGNPVSLVDPDGREVKPVVKKNYSNKPENPKKHSDLATTTFLGANWSFNNKTGVVDVMVNIRMDLSPQFDGRESTFLNSNPGILEEVVNHEDQHVEQYTEVFIEEQSLEIDGATYEGRSDEIMTQYFNTLVQEAGGVQVLNSDKSVQQQIVGKMNTAFNNVVLPAVDKSASDRQAHRRSNMPNDTQPLETDANNRARDKGHNMDYAFGKKTVRWN